MTTPLSILDRPDLAAVIGDAIRRKNIEADDDDEFPPRSEVVSRLEVVQEVLNALADAGWMLLPPGAVTPAGALQ